MTIEKLHSAFDLKGKSARAGVAVTAGSRARKPVSTPQRSAEPPDRRPLTDKLVRELVLPDGKQKVIVNDAPAGLRDTAFVPGLGVRLTPGSKTFVLRYRADNRDRLIKIGPYPAWSVAAARDRARALRRQVDTGGDPQADRSERLKAPTVAALFEQFIIEYGPKLRPTTLAGYKSEFVKHIAGDLGGRKAVSIAHRDIEELHHRITRAGSPYTANRVVALLSRLFSVAVKWGVVEDHPAKGIERNQETKRTRYLSAEEAQRLLAALPQLKHRQSADAIRLLLFTGARRGEVLRARWEQFDLPGMWIKPGSTTKQKTEHRVPLSSVAQALVADMHQRRRSDEWLFPAVHGGDGPQDSLKRAWESVRELADLPGVRIHDLRHSFASFVASDGGSLPLIGAMLGHSQPATTARYAHLFDDAQRAAADRVGNLLSGLESGTKASVVPIARKQRK